MACAAHVVYLLVNGIEENFYEAFGLFCLASIKFFFFTFYFFLLLYGMATYRHYQKNWI
jgi:hypothetical protein